MEAGRGNVPMPLSRVLEPGGKEEELDEEEGGSHAGEGAETEEDVCREGSRRHQADFSQRRG